MDPVQTGPQVKRGRVCKRQGWRFIIPSPGELEGEEWDAPAVVKDFTQDAPAQPDFNFRPGTRSSGIQVWRFHLPSSDEFDTPSSDEFDGADKTSETPDAIVAPVMELNGKNNRMKPGFRSRNGAKSGEMRNGRLSKIGTNDDRPVRLVWSAVGRRSGCFSIPTWSWTPTRLREALIYRFGGMTPNPQYVVKRGGRSMQIGKITHPMSLLIKLSLSWPLTTHSLIGYLLRPSCPSVSIRSPKLGNQLAWQKTTTQREARNLSGKWVLSLADIHFHVWMNSDPLKCLCKLL
ncbi:unnamed protein product [Linum trigynum]